MNLHRIDVVIDAGGSWVRAHAYDEDKCIDSVELRRPANPNYVGIDRTLMALEAACESLGQKLGQGKSIRAITCAVAGAGKPEVRETIVDSLARAFLCDVFVCSDAESMLEAAAESGPVTVLIAGTGAIAMGRRVDGSLVRNGGLAPEGGDPGSGRWLAQQGRSRLAEECSKVTDDFEVGPLIERLAADGHGEARRILEEGAAALAQLLVDLEPDAGPLVLEGGVVTQSQMVRELLLERVGKVLPQLQLAPSWREPSWGALQLARRAQKDEQVWWA